MFSKKLSKILTNRFKNVIHNLLYPKQNILLDGRSTFDNIIVV